MNLRELTRDAVLAAFLSSCAQPASLSPTAESNSSSNPSIPSAVSQGPETRVISENDLVKDMAKTIGAALLAQKIDVLKNYLPSYQDINDPRTKQVIDDNFIYFSDPSCRDRKIIKVGDVVDVPAGYPIKKVALDLDDKCQMKDRSGIGAPFVSGYGQRMEIALLREGKTWRFATASPVFVPASVRPAPVLTESPSPIQTPKDSEAVQNRNTEIAKGALGALFNQDFDRMVSFFDPQSQSQWKNMSPEEKQNVKEKGKKFAFCKGASLTRTRYVEDTVRVNDIIYSIRYILFAINPPCRYVGDDGKERLGEAIHTQLIILPDGTYVDFLPDTFDDPNVRFK